MEDGGVIDCDGNGPVPETVEEDGADVVAFFERQWTLVAMGCGREHDVDEAPILERGGG